MSSVPISKSNESGLAERRAADVSSARQQLGAGRETLERYRSDELAEAEALALARIKADTQRALAHQTQTLRDAERAAELAAIERHAADLDAIKEAQRREALDKEATCATNAKAEANRLAVQAALEKKSAIANAHQAHQAKLIAEREALAAQRGHTRARIGLALIALRCASPIMVGLGALLLGAGGGWLFAEHHSTKQPRVPLTDEAPLKLETELSALPMKY